MTKLRDKVVAVTGAASGIGRAVAVRLAARGAHLALADINEAALRETASLLSGVRVSTHVVDVRSREAVERYAAAALDVHGGVDVVVNNAGTSVFGSLEAVSYQDFAFILDVNMWGVVYGTRAFLPLLRQRPSGHVVNISSINAMVPFANNGPYNMSKYAVLGFSETLQLELAGQPIHVMCVHPGGIKTNIAHNSKNVTKEQAAAFGRIARTSAEAAGEAIVRGIEKNKRQIFIGLDAKTMALAKRLAPKTTLRVTGAVLRASGVLAVAAVVACSGASPGSPGDSGPPSTTDASSLAAQGCAPGRPATAYVAQVTSSAPTSAPAGPAPFPCLSLTGLGTSESSLGITSDGTVYVAPAYTAAGNGVARSTDHGATWQAIVPSTDGGSAHGRVQPFFYLDPSTNRMFFATSNSAGGFDLSTSDDDAATWSYERISTDAKDWIKIFAGPPVTSHPSGYPNLVYTSAPSPISTPSGGLIPGPDHQTVYKSLNGGAAWTSVGGTSLTLNPSAEVTAGLASAATCPSTEWVIFGDGVVGPDGAVYLGYRMCTELAIAISHDEGATWSSVVVPGSVLPAFTSLTSPLTTQNLLASEPVAVDSSGNIYAVWNDASGLVHLSVSRDHGATWSSSATGQDAGAPDEADVLDAAPIVISAPGVTQTVLSAITVKAPGTIAIAYFGSSDGKSFDGYLAESVDALDPAPIFWSTTVNDPSDPFFTDGFDNNYAASLSGGDLDELIQVKYAPDGDVWVSFLKEMCPGLKKTACTWDYATHANSVFQGAVGRLVHPAVTGGDASLSAEAEAP